MGGESGGRGGSGGDGDGGSAGGGRFGGGGEGGSKGGDGEEDWLRHRTACALCTDTVPENNVKTRVRYHLPWYPFGDGGTFLLLVCLSTTTAHTLQLSASSCFTGKIRAMLKITTRNY